MNTATSGLSDCNQLCCRTWPDSIAYDGTHGSSDPFTAVDSIAMKSATVLPTPDLTSGRERLQRLRSMAWLLDNAIGLPGGFRIGLDAIIGLIPGVGDAVGALISVYILNEARILGAPRSVLMRMSGNVLLEALVGSIPLLGDLFDAGFKANMRNIALLERYHLDPAGSRRSSRAFVVIFTLLLLALLAALIAVPILVVIAIVRAF
jgi:Domain of unknown function (DUF4112)